MNEACVGHVFQRIGATDSAYGVWHDGSDAAAMSVVAARGVEKNYPTKSGVFPALGSLVEVINSGSLQNAYKEKTHCTLYE